MIKPYYLQLCADDQPYFMMDHAGFSGDSLKTAEQQRWLIRVSETLARTKKLVAETLYGFVYSFCYCLTCRSKNVICWLHECGMWDKISSMTKPRIYTMSFANIYPLYVTKAEKKGRTKSDVDEIIRWLTGYSQQELEAQLEKQTDLESFIAEAPQLNPARALIKGLICGVRVEDIEEPTMQEIRYLDKLIDELARGKTMEKILRTYS